MKAVRFISYASFLIIFSLIATGCGFIPYLNPQPTSVPTAAVTPTKIPTCTATVTPTPSYMEISDVLNNCQSLSDDKREVVIEGKLFMPVYSIVGYQDWKAMNLAKFLPNDSDLLKVLIQVGEGPNTMDVLPEFFTERDLIVRADQEQTIRHGHSVRIIGNVEYRGDSPELKCAVRVNQISTLMDAEVLIPLDIQVKTLNTAGGLDNCSQLAFEKQMVRLKGSIVVSSGVTCQMGYCRMSFSDGTGSMFLTIVDALGKNSANFNSDRPFDERLKLLDSSGNAVELDDLNLTGVVYSEQSRCNLMVYTIEQGPQP